MNRAALIENRPDAIPLLRPGLISDTGPDLVKDEGKDEDDEFLNPLDMDVDDDEDLLVSHYPITTELSLAEPWL